jgi:predicted nucleotidyltransferase
MAELKLLDPTEMRTYYEGVNRNQSLPALDGKLERLVELCREFQVKRLEIFGSAATDAFRPESSDFDFLVDFGNRSLGPCQTSRSKPNNCLATALNLEDNQFAIFAGSGTNVSQQIRHFVANLS